MIKHIYTLKEEYKEKELYIWDVSEKTIWVFERLAYRLIPVSGFVSENEDFIGQQLFNRPVILLSEMKSKTNAIILCDDYESDKNLNRIREYCIAEQLNNVFELNPELFQKELYMYGTGKNAWDLSKVLSDNSISLKGFIQTKKERKQLLDLPVLQFDEIKLNDNEAIIVSLSVVNEILEHVQQLGYTGELFINELVLYQDLWSVLLFQMIAKAVNLNKNILLCCDDDMTRKLLNDILLMYGIIVKRNVCLKGNPQKKLGDIYSLADEDPLESVLIVHDFIGEKRCEMVEAAAEMGFSEEKGNCAGIYPIGYNRKKWNKEFCYEYDGLIGVSIDYSYHGGLPGWAIYGNLEKADFRIMVLGGSTSSEMYHTENWIKHLYVLLHNKGYSVCIFNGAHEANAVNDEMQRMVRDLSIIKPDIIISMSGVNDMQKKPDKFNRFNKENSLIRWKRIESYMKAIAEKEGASFFAFLQPINKCMQDTSLYENIVFINASNKGRGFDFFKEVKDDDFYINLLRLFHHRNDMFIDAVHYSDKAHKELAQIVYETIEPELRNYCNVRDNK